MSPFYARRVQELARDDRQLQALAPDAAVLADLNAPDQSLERIVTTLLDGYAERPALGERSYEVVHGARRYLPEFDTLTYAELGTRVRSLAGAWQHDPDHRLGPGEFVCVLGFGGVDFTVVDLATVYAQAVGVPLQPTLAGVDLTKIMTDTAPAVVAAGIDALPLAAQLAGGQPSVRSLLVLGYEERVDDDRKLFAAAEEELARSGSRATLVRLDGLVARRHPWAPLSPSPEGDDRMALLIHSSGSTGTPKGVIMDDRYARTQFTASVPVPLPVVRLIFAPLNHLMGRGALYTTLARGGTAYFTARPDMSTLFEDFRLVRPTEVAMFPRVFEMIHQHYLTETARRPDADVREEMRETLLGDRIAFILSGSAPTTPEIRDFIRETFPVTFADAYSTTEAGPAVLIRDRINWDAVIDYKLVDVPELGYHTSDEPYPRGELCVKARIRTPGYFKNPEATARLFDADGFVRTGDIMEQRGPDQLTYLDRRNDVLKLAQGEFVTLGALGATFETLSDVISQIHLYGNSARAFLLAVVVPEPGAVAERLGADPTGAQLRALIRGELTNVAAEANLRSFEVPRDFLIEPEPFSHANGLLSSVHKRMRPRFDERYGARLERLYEEIARAQDADLRALGDPSSAMTPLERIGKALEASLGLEHVDPEEPLNFTDLGGDSLAAVGFSQLLGGIFGVDVPVSAILSPAGSPARWAQLVEQTSGAGPTFASIHGEGATTLRAADLDIDRFLSGAAVAAELPSTETRTVLLTGATGFLGRHLCLEWLERLDARGGKLVCLVRAVDPSTARTRLDAAFDGDPELARRFRSLAAGRLEVLVGDVDAPRLGLDEQTYSRLALDVDRIVHPAALVNHVLGYGDLFGPNVAGTARLVELALAGRRKHFDFVSSMAVTALLDGRPDEDTPLRAEVELTERYTAGYAASKWGAEQLLLSAHARYALPVSIFRGDMILPHRVHRKQVNVPDVFVRLLTSLIATGIAPSSFYRPGSGPAHYDGLPVDFVAASIVEVGRLPREGAETFHVVNSHWDDGISLDTIADWIDAAGYPLRRVAPYGEWLRRFEDALRHLPEDQRSRSSLAVIDSLRTPARAGVTAGSARFDASAGPIPHLTQELLTSWLADLHQLGLVPEAQ
ncbi:thioester reductase domain-containing protein [Cryptosporangium sp. NPDC051539]|uniref:thioester reductase domain-containing protein n=1 Tax=Cryptosporangium sp. NPDC051539 TaxID=3363962 RepID=UPI0037AD7108